MIRTAVDIDLSRRETIQTDNLIFRRPEVGDLPQLLEFARDPLLIKHSISRSDFTPYGLKLFIGQLPNPPTPMLTMFGVFFKEAPEELYGTVSYALREGNTVPRMTLWIRAKYRRRRFLAEVPTALLDFAFLVHRLDAIHADAFPDQKITPALALKYGFKFIGYRMEFSPMQEREIVLSVMELTRDEWLDYHRERFVRRSSMVHPLPQRSLSPHVSSLA
ncbi:GNAT family N-acetyltransferase [Rhodoligotrophos defluvii]|uniref:GNAT family N-acetyltransferase n=1 Tax=Rhodoligotrophos defluvii TaxID=2561934 RepID=UPI0010C9BFC1|nr:GNAT family protein [Rhodoligotrophos defluvii]